MNPSVRRIRDASLLVLVLQSAAIAAEPAIRNLSVRGLQIGGTTTLTVDGEELGKAPRLVLPFPAKQELQAKNSDKQATFDVALGPDVVPGFYNLRVAAEGGVSLPVVIAVDRLPQKPFAASMPAIPVALHGVAAGSSPVESTFAGKAGQSLLIEVEAQRLGGKLRPVVHLYGPRRRHLGWAWSTPALGGDARLEATLPEDGAYTIAVHDLEYAPQAPNFFRLKVGQWAYVDQAFPPCVPPGRHGIELLGRTTTTRVEVEAKSNAAYATLPWPKDGIWSGPRPFVAVSSRTEVLEPPAAAKPPDLPAGSVAVTGRLATPFEEDRFRLPVKPGTKVRFEVVADRLGSPLDAALVIRNEAGADLARAEDSPNSLDPVLEYTPPDKTSTIQVAVVDAQGRGGPRAIYRLLIDPQESGSSERSFRLQTPLQRLTVPVDGKVLMPVMVERRGYAGRVTISADGLPAGVQLDNAVIPADADGTLVVVQRSGGAAAAVVTRWKGRADDGREQALCVKGHPLEKLQPWLAEEIAVGFAPAKAGEFQVDWRGLPADAALVLASRLTLPVKLTRPATNSLVRLTLLTSQLTPLVNNQPDPNQALRAERPVELPDKANEGELTLLVPPQLAAAAYDVAVQAELLAPDKQRVLAVAYAPVRRLNVRNPLIVQLRGPDRIPVKVDPKKGATATIPGKVERRDKLNADVAITVVGLPAGVRAEPVTVKAGTTDFTVNVVLPANVAATEIKGIKLAGAAAPDPKQPNVRVRSKEVEFTLVVQK